jgi:hypothetical protein
MVPIEGTYRPLLAKVEIDGYSAGYGRLRGGNDFRKRRDDPMPRRPSVDPALPPLPRWEKRDVQVKIRLAPSEIAKLKKIRPDLKPSAIVAQLVNDVLADRYHPAWAAPSEESSDPTAGQ